MKRRKALKKAELIARFINDGVFKLMHDTPLEDLPLMAMLPLFKLGADAEEGKDLDFNLLKLRIFEILIFGPLANKSQEKIEDIGMMVLDNGFCSTFFMLKKAEDGWPEELSENLNIFLKGWLGYSTKAVKDILSGVKVDLHLLPMKLLKSMTVRADIANKHSDPHFLQNAFSSMLRYDKSAEKFVPADISYFETKYETDLSDLRMS